MSEQLQLRSGSSANIAAFTGAAAECVVDSTNNRLVLQDGATAGGWPAAKLAEVMTLAMCVEQTPLSASGSILGPGLTRITTPGITVTLPSTWAFPSALPIMLKEWTGNSSPNITVSSGVNIDGLSTGLIITVPKQLVALYWSTALTAWIIG